MQPTEQAEYRLPQDFCCANKTVLNCPSSSADTFNVYNACITFNCLLQCVEMKFECCSENKSESHTVYIKEGLKRWNTDEAVLSLMKKIVDAISLEKDGSITITLINQAKIIGGNKNASSNTID